jgi:hypothetical protein
MYLAIIQVNHQAEVQVSYQAMCQVALQVNLLLGVIFQAVLLVLLRLPVQSRAQAPARVLPVHLLNRQLNRLQHHQAITQVDYQVKVRADRPVKHRVIRRRLLLASRQVIHQVMRRATRLVKRQVSHQVIHQAQRQVIHQVSYQA